MSHNIPAINSEPFDIIATLLEKADAQALSTKSNSLAQAQRLKALVDSTITLSSHLNPELATRLAEQADAARFLKLSNTATLGTTSGFGLSSTVPAAPASQVQSSHSDDDEGHKFKH